MHKGEVWNPEWLQKRTKDKQKITKKVSRTSSNQLKDYTKNISEKKKITHECNRLKMYAQNKKIRKQSNKDSI